MKNAKKLNFKKFKINNSSLLNLPIKCIYVYIYVFYIRLKLNHFCCTNDIVAFTCSRVGTKYCDRQSGIYMKIWNFLITLSPCLILHTRPVLQFFTTWSLIIHWFLQQKISRDKRVNSLRKLGVKIIKTGMG